MNNAQIARWSEMPTGLRQHLTERMRDRKISLEDLNRLREWIQCRPGVPEGDWYKDFALSSLAAKGSSRKHFCFPGKLQPAKESSATRFLRCLVPHWHVLARMN